MGPEQSGLVPTENSCESDKMHVVINALTIHAGGGLTVILGLVRGLRLAQPAWKITVLTSNDRVNSEILKTGSANSVHRVLPEAGAERLAIWQMVSLNRWLRANAADVMIAVNHFIPNISCHQVIYHLNLLRFQPASPSAGWRARFGHWLRNRAAKRALTYASANVFESEYLRTAAEEYCRTKIRNPSIIYIGLPDNLINSPSRNATKNTSSRRIASITNVAVHKDNPTLVRMLAELVSKEPDAGWCLDIAGGTDPKAWEPLKALATQLNVIDRITFHGFCDEPKLTMLLQQALCMVSASRVESFAMVALESMARGCPPVVSDCASMPESVGNAGLLAAPGDPVSFANAVRSLADDPAAQFELVERGYAWIERFRWSSCGTSFAALLKSIVESKSIAS